MESRSRLEGISRPFRDLLEGDRTSPAAELGHGNDGIFALAGLETATIAALNGAAFGGGAAEALTTDFRVMGDRARLGSVFGRLGPWGQTPV